MPYPSPFPELVDSTMLVSWRGCNVKGAYEHIDLLSPGPNIHFHFGGALAAGLERARKDFFIRGLPAREAENNGLNAASDYWGDFQSDDNAKNWGSLLQSISGYFKQWPLDCDYVVPLKEGGIEFTFALPIPEALRPDRPEPIIWAGRFDLLGTWHGMNAILDEKTTGKGFTSSWSQSWGLRNQFLMYVWACRQSGIPVDKVIVRGISVLKTKLDFTEAIVTIPEFLVARAYTQVVRDLNRLAEQWRTDTFDYNFGDTCTAFGGCPFRVCCEAQNPREWMSLFGKRTWSPLAKDPEAKP